MKKKALRASDRRHDPLIRSFWVALAIAVVVGGAQLGAHLALHSGVDELTWTTSTVR